MISTDRASPYLPFILQWIFMLLLLVGNGCNKKPEATFPVFPVDGQILAAGKPAVGAVVTFHPVPAGEAAPSFIATALVRADGHFLPTLPDGRIGLAAGKYVLTAVWNEGEADRWKGKYADPQHPIQQITVITGLNLIPPIKLNP